MKTGIVQHHIAEPRAPITLGSVGVVLTHWHASEPPEGVRPGQCTWPMWGDGPPDGNYCRQPIAASDRPYCAEHAGKAARKGTEP